LSDPPASCATPLPRRAALYARVSTADQSLETQVQALRAAAEGRGYEVTLVYRETVSGAGNRPRPEFERLRTSVQADAVDAVFILKLDRLARSVRDALAFFEEAEAHRVRVVVTTQDIDTGTPVGRLTRTILAAMAEFEGELIRERTRSAMAAIKAGTKPTRTGRRPGRPRRVSPEIAERARVLRAEGLRWAEIAQQTGQKAETLRRAVWALKPRPVAVVNPRPFETGSSPGGEGAGG